MAPVHPAVYGALTHLAYALAIGLLVGLERGWTQRGERAGSRVAGLRTYGLLGLCGGAAGMLPWPFALLLLLLCGSTVVLGYLRSSRDTNTVSITGTVAALIVLALGLVATLGRPVEAFAAAAAMMFLLSMRQPLHRVLRGLSATEMRAAARFAIVALLLLPLAPDQAFGPYGAVNPHRLVAVVVLVAGLSFVGYVLARRADAARSEMMVAALGAVVSSTAVTAALARRLRTTGPAGPLAAGIAIASLISVSRVGVLIAILEPRALLPLVALLSPAALILAAAGWWARRQSASQKFASIKLGNPLELGTAIGLALLVIITSIASRWALERFGGLGAEGILAATGLADVDAAVLSFAAMPDGMIGPARAGIVLASSVLCNLVLKTGLTIVLAGGSTGRRASAPLALAAVALLAAILVAVALM